MKMKNKSILIYAFGYVFPSRQVFWDLTSAQQVHGASSDSFFDFKLQILPSLGQSYLSQFTETHSMLTVPVTELGVHP